ncbi:hypothetical protein [Alloacidobacterium sp.]|uniref:hypothetical protein n=1 Tax=Alloacidobacterium sp. TaxID=2951999 RepID=UPI002D5DCE27|nr:hypothetical protein [Alloacidobacterium sp.]HYK35469.1 hypothetical protein [Alloacidobacterium sp.]
MYLSKFLRRVALVISILVSLTGHTVSAQTPPDVPDAPASGNPPKISQPKSQHDQAAEDLKREEHQRILGIVPDFNMMDNAKAPPLSPGQKFHLFWKSTTDPYAFFVAGFVAGYGQANNSNPGYGQGAAGYFKRYGAAYTDAFDGNLWGNAILPVWWREDPRYFRKGTGSTGRRVLHAALSTVWCRRDNGTWGPNYANVTGNMIGGAISNLYYPKEDRGPELVFGNALTVTAEGAIGAQLVEFWPDIVRHYRNKKSKQASAQSPSSDAESKQ